MSFNDAVSAQQGQGRKRNTKRLCGSHIEHGFKFGRPVNRKVGGFDPWKNLIDEQGCKSAHLMKIDAVANQGTRLSKFTG